MQSVCGHLVLACLLTAFPVAFLWGLEGIVWWGIFWGYTLSWASVLRRFAPRLGIVLGVDLLTVLEFLLLVPTLVVAIVFGGLDGFKWWGLFWGFALSLTSIFWNAAHRRR